VSKARIAVVSPFVDKRHGTERCLAEQLERLARDYEIHLFSSRVEDTDLSGIEWHRVPEIPGPHLAKYLFWFAANHVCRWNARRRAGRPYDLVYSPGINCLDADVVLVHVVFAELLRKIGETLRLSRNPVSGWTRILHRRLYYRLIIALERRIYAPGETRLAAVSRKTWTDIENHYGPRRPATIAYSGIDPRRFDPEIRKRARAAARETLGVSPGRFALLMVGNDFKNKGLECLLRAVRKIGDRRLLVLVCGHDDPAPYEGFRAGPDAVETVFLPIRRDVELYYAAADACIGPSLEDAFSLPPLEAMGSGLPVVVSRTAGASEIVTHGRDALILENPNDADELALLIGQICNDESLRQRLSEQAAVTARQFTWDASTEQVKQLFELTLAAKTSEEFAVAR
jgi:glycosyltransferase involved in cell wall biosynthesis